MTIVFLSVRVLHVLGAALWLGSVTLIAFILMPVLQQAGAAGGSIMAGMERRGLVKFMASVSGLTILSGIWLFWRLTGGFDPAQSNTAEGRVFGLGGILGLAAGIIGGVVVGRSAKKANDLGAQASKLSEGPQRAAIVAEIQTLRQRMITYGHVVVFLLIVTIALMTIGHYV